MKKLIFVYNADSGKFNALTDSLHKLISPDTYECRLCELTHGFFSEKSDWSKFLKESNFEAEFLHRDEFISEYESFSDYLLPAVFELKNDKLSSIISAESFKEIQDLPALCEKISKLS